MPLRVNDSPLLDSKCAATNLEFAGRLHKRSLDIRKCLRHAQPAADSLKCQTRDMTRNGWSIVRLQVPRPSVRPTSGQVSLVHCLMNEN